MAERNACSLVIVIFRDQPTFIPVIHPTRLFFFVAIASSGHISLADAERKVFYLSVPDYRREWRYLRALGFSDPLLVHRSFARARLLISFQFHVVALLCDKHGEGRESFMTINCSRLFDILFSLIWILFFFFFFFFVLYEPLQWRFKTTTRLAPERAGFSLNKHI